MDDDRQILPVDEIGIPEDSVQAEVARKRVPQRAIAVDPAVVEDPHRRVER
jgi:hypothetical protein